MCYPECMGAIFEDLERTVMECRRCPRLVAWRERVAREKVRRHQQEEYWGRPVPAFGGPDARLIVVGLAPAAHGGNRTGRMFTGDRSGEWLYEALHRFGFASQPISMRRDDGLVLHDCLITAVIRCAPPDNKPLPEEIGACREYLHGELLLAARRKVVVALGQIAFRAFLRFLRDRGERPPSSPPGVGGAGFTFGHAREWTFADGSLLISSYHPSQQNTQTGKLTKAMFDEVFRRARQALSG